MALRLINVDLDIQSSGSLERLCSKLVAGGMDSLYCGDHQDGFFARFECVDGGDEYDADEVIQKFCGIVEGLDESGERDWESADRRVFDVGYQATDGSDRWATELKNPTLLRVAKLGATVALTVYPVEPEVEGEFEVEIS